MIFEKVVIAVGMLFSHFLNGSTIFELGASFKPDFMVIFVIFFALRKGALYGLWIGFFGGLLTDSSLGGEIGNDELVYYKVGLHSLSYSLIGYLVGKFARSAYNENYLSITVYAAGFTFFSRMITYLLFILFFHPNDSYSFISTTIYTAILAPVFFFVLTWAYRLHQDQGEV